MGRKLDKTHAPTYEISYLRQSWHLCLDVYCMAVLLRLGKRGWGSLEDPLPTSRRWFRRFFAWVLLEGAEDGIVYPSKPSLALRPPALRRRE